MIETIEYDIRLHTQLCDNVEYIVDVREDTIVNGEEDSQEYVEGLIFDSYEKAKLQVDKFIVTYSKKGKVHVTDEPAYFSDTYGDV